jgi:hypothetical protein
VFCTVHLFSYVNDQQYVVCGAMTMYFVLCCPVLCCVVLSCVVSLCCPGLQVCDPSRGVGRDMDTQHSPNDSRDHHRHRGSLCAVLRWCADDCGRHHRCISDICGASAGLYENAKKQRNSKQVNVFLSFCIWLGGLFDDVYCVQHSFGLFLASLLHLLAAALKLDFVKWLHGSHV